MHVETIPCGPLEVNCYIVWQEGSKTAVAIDPADDAPVLSFLTEKRLTLSHILLTNGHVDHILGIHALKNETNASICIHKADAEMLESEEACLATALYLHIQPTKADQLLEGGETIQAAGLSFQVLHTPGHTPGGVCFVAEDVIFTGDTLFRLSVGRSDFPGSNESDLMHSIIDKLFALPGDYTLYPGHMRPSTLDFERERNPFARMGLSW
mgnify:CR=1 FL=1